jgi:methyl-accepting chemotaxis protein
MSIRTRLLAGLLVVAVAFGIVAAVAYRDLMSAQERTETMRVEAVEPLIHLRRLRSSAEEAINWGAIFRVEPRHIAGAVQGVVDGDAVIGQELQALAAYPLPATVKARLADVVRITSGLEKSGNVLLKTNMPILDPSAPEIPLPQQGAALNERSAAIVEAVNVLEEVQRTQEQALTDTYDTARRNLLIGLAAAFAVAVVSALVTAASIVRPVRRTVAVLDRVATGDLTPRLATGRDETGQMGDALNQTLDQVGSVIESIDLSATQLSEQSAAFMTRSADLAAATSAVAHDAEQASTGVNRVSRDVAQMATAADELTTVVDDVAAKAREGSQAAEQASAVAARLGRDVADPAPLDNLAGMLADVAESQARVQAGADAQVGLSGQIRATAANLATSTETIDQRVDSVAAAVGLTAQFVEDTNTDAEQLAELSDLLDTLTSVFQHEKA